MVRVQVGLSDEMHAYLKRRAAEIGTSLSALCAVYISEHVKQAQSIEVLSQLQRSLGESNQPTP